LEGGLMVVFSLEMQCLQYPLGVKKVDAFLMSVMQDLAMLAAVTSAVKGWTTHVPTLMGTLLMKPSVCEVLGGQFAVQWIHLYGGVWPGD
jgi:hypothetical protein